MTEAKVTFSTIRVLTLVAAMWLLTACGALQTAASPLPTAEKGTTTPDVALATDQPQAISTLLASTMPATVIAGTVALPTVTPTPGLSLPTVTPMPALSATLSAALTLSTTLTPGATDAGASQYLTVIVSGDLVNLRDGPDVVYAVAAQAPAGARLTPLGRSADNGWWQVCCAPNSTQTVWVRSDLVTVTGAAGALAALPIVEAPATPIASVQSDPAQAAALAAAPASGLPGDGGFGVPGGVNPLTGIAMPAGSAIQRPVIVCINNDPAARPQFGISQADVVYEYLMEGYGVTRFSAIFYGDATVQIGPVRSARLINYTMGALYDAGLTCSGASDRVRYMLKHEAPFPYMDIDLDDPSNTRYSVSLGSDYRTRLRTSSAGLQRWLTDWGVAQPPHVRGFTFGSAPSGVAATVLRIPYPAYTGSQVEYRFDPGSGRNLRFLGGAAHLDGNSGAQVAVENVIVQFAPHEATDIVEDSLGSTSIRIDLFGSGKAILFRDGQVYDVSWRSASRGDTPHFYAADGSEIPLKPGRTWISVAPSSYVVSF